MRIIWDEAVVRDVNQSLAATTEEQASTLDLKRLFGDHYASAFLYPLLAQSGQKGQTILLRLLAEYKESDSLDNGWLLIVAALGQAGSGEAEAALLAELDRVNTVAAAKQGPVFRDVRRPLLDALIANRIRLQGKADVDWLAMLVRKAPAEAGFIWTDAIEWADAVGGEAGFQRQAMLEMPDITEAEAKRFMDSGEMDERLRCIRDSMTRQKRRWRQCLQLFQAAPEAPAARKEFLRLVVCHTMFLG